MNGKGMPVKSAVFPDDRIMRFKRLVAERCGLCFKDHDLRSLKGAVDKRRAICGIEGLEEYYGYLMTSRNGEDEFIELLNLLTVNHTYFFRNEPHFRALARNVLPGIIRRKREKKGFPGLVQPSQISWSAGVSPVPLSSATQSPSRSIVPGPQARGASPQASRVVRSSIGTSGGAG